MKIISGKYRNRDLKNLKNDNTRATSQMVKEAIFNMISPYLNYNTFLDLFAGTGNLGFESFSRGYNNGYFVDNNKEALNTIKYNNKLLNEKGIILNKDYLKALEYFKNNNIKFDLIFLDPPYKLRILEEIIKLISYYDLLLNNGIIVLEYDVNYKINLDNINYNVIKNKTYKIRNITVLRKE